MGYQVWLPLHPKVVEYEVKPLQRTLKFVPHFLLKQLPYVRLCGQDKWLKRLKHILPNVVLTLWCTPHVQRPTKKASMPDLFWLLAQSFFHHVFWDAEQYFDGVLFHTWTGELRKFPFISGVSVDKHSTSKLHQWTWDHFFAYYQTELLTCFTLFSFSVWLCLHCKYFNGRGGFIFWNQSQETNIPGCTGPMKPLVSGWPTVSLSCTSVS